MFRNSPSRLEWQTTGRTFDSPSSNGVRAILLDVAFVYLFSPAMKWSGITLVLVVWARLGDATILTHECPCGVICPLRSATFHHPDTRSTCRARHVLRSRPLQRGRFLDDAL